MADRVVSVRLSADVNDFRRGMQQAASDTEKVAQSTQKAKSSVSDFGKFATKLLSGAAVASFATDSIKAASDLQQSLGKTTDIFGKQATAVQTWSKTSATAFGLSQQAALEAASTFGDMFTQLGFSGDKAAGLSEQVVQLAGDLGAFNNLPTADVLDRIGGAFRGEYDALQKVIPNISAARVQTEAMAATGKKNADSLTAQEKATAVLAIVQRDGAKAAGNYAKTAGDAATQQQTVAAQFENTKAAVGQSLLPVYQSLLSAFQDSLPVIEGIGKAVGGLVSFVADLPGPVKLAASAFGGFLLLQKANVFSKLATGIASFKQEMAFASYGMSTFGDKAKSIGKSLGAGGLVAGAAVLVSAIVDGFNEHVTPAVVDFSSALDAATGQLSATASEALSAAGAFDNLAKAGVGAATYLGALQGNAGDVKATLDGLQESLRAAFASGDNERIDAAATALAQFNTDLKGVADAQRHQKQEADAARAAMDSYASTLTGAIDAQDRQSRSTKIVTTDLATYRDVSNQAERAATTHADAVAAGVIASQKAIVAEGAHAAALQAVQTAASDAVAKSEALREKLDDLSPAAQAAASAESDLSRAVENVNAAMDKDKSKTYEDALREMHGAITDLSTAFGQGTDQQEHFTAGMVKANGQINTGTKQGQDLYDTVTRLASSQHAAAQAAFENAGGLTHQKAATQAAKDVAGQAYTAFMNSAAAQELGATKAHELAVQYGLIPSDVSTAVRSNAAEEKGKVDAYNRSLAEANGKVVTSTIQTVYESVKKTTVDPITHFLFGAHAAGGTITGGIAGKDSVPTLLMPGEEVIRTDAANQGNNRSVLKAMNAGLLRFAAGGSVPGGAAALAGIAPRSPGAREGVSLGALDDILAWVRNVQADATDAAHAASQALQAYREARNAQREAIAAQKTENSERLRGAKTAKERASAEKRNREEMARTVASQNAKVNAAIRERTAADRTAAALKAKADAEGRAWNATARLRGVTGNLTRAYDAATNKLAVDTDRLNSLRSDRAQLAGSVASGIRGIGGGVAGFQEQRTTVASILNGAAYNARLAGSFKTDLARLTKLGLNAQTLAELSDPSNAGTAHILASGGIGDIRRLNSLVGQTNAFASQAGNLVAGATFDPRINVAQNVVVSDQRAQRNFGIALNASAKGLARAFSDAIDGHLAKVTRQELAILVRRGETELKRRGA